MVAACARYQTGILLCSLLILGYKDLVRAIGSLACCLLLDEKSFMMKRKNILPFLLFPLMLIGCIELPITADTFPWVRDERVLFKDSFSHKSGGWTTHEDSVSYAGYEQDGFRLMADVPNYQFWSVPGLNFKDTQIFTRARILSGPDDPTSA